MRGNNFLSLNEVRSFAEVGKNFGYKKFCCFVRPLSAAKPSIESLNIKCYTLRDFFRRGRRPRRPEV